MRALVTGAAGFIGSHLAERLCYEGWGVVGVDSLRPYYDTDLKQQNLDVLRAIGGFEFIKLDLSEDPLGELLDSVDVVFHQAGQPGVRASWDDFGSYLKHNVEATRALLEAAKGANLKKLVFASSSSIYGGADQYPTMEDALPRPQSPYGVSKLAAEHLCGVYARSFGIPIAVLRYFTVYGPRQRPDMAMNRLIASVVSGGRFPLYGDGSQIRDFTYVGDVVEANLLAGTADLPPGWTANVAGGSPTTMNHVIEVVEDVLGDEAAIDPYRSQAGDVPRTGGSIARISADIGWEPRVSLEEGLRSQIEWQKAAAEAQGTLAAF